MDTPAFIANFTTPKRTTQKCQQQGPPAPRQPPSRDHSFPQAVAGAAGMPSAPNALPYSLHAFRCATVLMLAVTDVSLLRVHVLIGS